MTLRTYNAKTMADALAEVKRDLGPEAVILHTRSYKVGGWLGVGGKPMVEITASSGVNVMSPAERRRRAREGAPSGPAPAPLVHRTNGQASPSIGVVPQATPAPRPAEAPAGAPDPVGLLTGPDPAPTGPRGFGGGRPVPAYGPGVLQTPDPADLQEELIAIKRMVGRVLQSTRETAVHAGRISPAPAPTQGAGTDVLFEHYLRLLDNEVAPDLADALVGEVRDELSTPEMGDRTIVRETLLRHIERRIRVAPPGPEPEPGPRVITLVGPTGVGKTTSVAKLAATYKLRHGRRVGLITSDTYRIAAVDQLRTYAGIIGLPIKIVMTPDEMAEARKSLSDCDVVLVDTAGRSQNDNERLAELAEFVRAADPHETHLVLASTSSAPVLARTAERFAGLRPDRVILTKLDEAVTHGVLASVSEIAGHPLSYVTTGQEVPDHIEAARADRLARMVLDGCGPGSAP